MGTHASSASFPPFTNNASQNENGSHFKDSEYLIKTGESHWPEFSDLGPMDILDPDKFSLNDPLENYIATLTDFLKAYRQKTSDEGRCRIFWRFSEYLSLMSWQKTNRRLNSWVSKGFIHGLVSALLRVLEVRAAQSRNPNPQRSNISLHFEVSSLHQAKGAVGRLMDLLTPLKSYLRLVPNNLDDLMLALEKEREDEDSRSESTHSSYNKRSSIQIHCLLIALLIGYMKALKDRDEVHKEEEEFRGDQSLWNATKKVERNDLMARKRHSQVHIWEFGRILWILTASRMFDDHLQSLQLPPVLPGEERGYAWLFDLLELEDKKSSGRNAGQSKRRNGDGHSVEVVHEGGKEDIEELHRTEIILMTSPIDQFRSWSRLITSHFEALFQVVSDAKNRSHHLEGKFTLVKCRNSPIPLEVDWRKIIRGLCNQDGTQSLANTASSGDIDDTATTSNQPLSSPKQMQLT